MPEPSDRLNDHRLKVLVIRHGIAEDRKAFGRTGQPDSVRPLTKEGRRKMRGSARGLFHMMPRLDVIVSSPLARAVETAEIVGRQFDLRAGRLAALAPGKPGATVLGWLQDQPDRSVVALVGHEPDLGQFVSWALTGLRESFLPMKKGGACLLEFRGEVKPARAKLIWAMRPAQLRSMAD